MAGGDLDAAIDIEGGDFVLQSKSAPAGAAAAATSGGATPAGSDERPPQPIRVSAMKARVELSGPDVKKLSGEFLIGSSPYRFEGSMINVMPAAAELALVGKRLAAAGQKQIPDPGTLLDGLANAPVVKFEISGRAFDAQPYQKPLFGPSGGGASPAPAAQPPAQAPRVRRERSRGGAPVPEEHDLHREARFDHHARSGVHGSRGERDHPRRPNQNRARDVQIRRRKRRGERERRRPQDRARR